MLYEKSATVVLMSDYTKYFVTGSDVCPVWIYYNFIQTKLPNPNLDIRYNTSKSVWLSFSFPTSSSHMVAWCIMHSRAFSHQRGHVAPVFVCNKSTDTIKGLCHQQLEPKICRAISMQSTPVHPGVAPNQGSTAPTQWMPYAKTGCRTSAVLSLDSRHLRLENVCCDLGCIWTWQVCLEGRAVAGTKRRPFFVFPLGLTVRRPQACLHLL